MSEKKAKSHRLSPSPLIIWVYLTKEERKQIGYGKVVDRTVGKIADILPLKIHIVKEEGNI